jgi:hypothetical protein
MPLFHYKHETRSHVAHIQNKWKGLLINTGPPLENRDPLLRTNGGRVEHQNVEE